MSGEMRGGPAAMYSSVLAAEQERRAVARTLAACNVRWMAKREQWPDGDLDLVLDSLGLDGEEDDTGTGRGTSERQGEGSGGG